MGGTLNTDFVLSTAPTAVQEIFGSVALSITVLRISNNQTGGQNSFFNKFREFTAGGAGTVNFDLAQGGTGPVVPEPGTMGMMASALAMSGGMFWRRRRTSPTEAEAKAA